MKSTEKYRLLFENTREAVFITTPDGRCIDVNPACLEMFGYASREEILDLDIGTDIFADPEEREKFRKQLEGNGSVKDYRVELRKKGGEKVVALATVTAVKDENGFISEYQGILHDITRLEQESEALKKTNDLLRTIIDTAPTAIIGLDLEGRIQAVWNRAAETMLGWNADEVMGRPLPTIPEEGMESFLWTQERIKNGKTINGLECRRKRSDGTYVDCCIYISPMRDKTGSVAGSIGVLVDITGRKRMDEALRESEERLKATLDAAHIVAWEINPDGSHREVGPTHELFGKPEGFYHPKLSDLFGSVHPEDRDGFESMVWSAMRGERDYQIEFRVPLQGDTVRWIEATGALQRDTRGNATRILGMARDITLRKRMEEALRESEERFKQLVRNSNDIIGLIDENGIQTSLSGPLEKILGYKPEELTGINAFGLIHPDDAENVMKVFNEIVRHPGCSRTVEYRMRHKNGKWVAVETVGTNLLREPAVKAIVANTRDITERTRLQDQLQQAMKMEAVGRLAGGVAHDFNNILTVISGNVELARMGLNPADPLNRCLDQVAKASESAASLTHQLLAFSRKQIIEPRVLNLNDLVRNVQQMLTRLIGENVTLRTALQDDLGSVKVDPGQFEQVLVNLAVNARDAMPEGGKLAIETANVTLDERYCETHPPAQPGRYVLLAVSDTGHGMSREVKEHLFEPFFTTKGTGHGTGLGLATTFGVVRQAGGFIEVYSEEGRGTTFKTYVPAVGEQAEKLVKESHPLDMLKGDETILLVEDEEAVRKMALRILKNLGYRVFEARDGEEALMLADRHGGRIDLLMTDIVMPGITGRELSELLTGLYPSIKTLFTSGYTEDVIVHHGVIDSQINFIGKPYSLQGLAGKIREILGPGRSVAARP